MTRRLVLLACLAALFGSSGCSDDDPTTQVQYFGLATTDFTAAQALAVTAPLTMVFRDTPSWQAFWLTHGPAGVPAPAIDFTQDMLIAVFWGPGYSGCVNWADAIDSVRLRIDGVNTLGVIEVDIGPVGDLGNCATPVLPMEAVLVDTTATAVTFVGMVPS